MYSPIIAAAGRDAQRVRNSGMRCLHLCTALTENGLFTVLQHPVCVENDLLGIADCGGGVRSPKQFASDAVALARSRRCSGVFADFQREDLSETVAALDEQCSRAGLSLWLPAELIDSAPHAICTIGTSISGGSLSDRFSNLLEHYGAEHLAAQLECICAKFSIPSPTPDGEPMTHDDAEALRRKHGAVPFFSHELCAKYFTFTEDNDPYFILFDDAETLQAKANHLTALGVNNLLLLYPDAAAMGLVKAK